MANLLNNSVEETLFLTSAILWVFRVQADWTLTHTSHKDTEQSTTEVSITLDGITWTDSLLR
jgi:hypothetical protein